jgi:hypothetical protein
VTTFYLRLLRVKALTELQEHKMERWLTTTAPGLVVLGLVTIFLAALIGKGATKLWRAYLKERVHRWLVQFLELHVRSFAISRILTNRYIHKQNYFRYVALTGFSLMAFTLSSVVQLLLFALIAVYFIVNGIRFSWALLVLFSLTWFFLLQWLKDAFYLFGG